MALERVRGYQASDGKIFPDEKYAEAEKYESDLQFRQWCEANLCRGGEWSARMIADAILEHWNLVSFKP